MLRDLEQGQPTEIEAITGAVVAEADRLGVATPANRLVAALIRARERAVTDGMEGDRTG
jgi:2-dehydropantoate 2-reductase